MNPRCNAPLSSNRLGESAFVVVQVGSVFREIFRVVEPSGRRAHRMKRKVKDTDRFSHIEGKAHGKGQRYRLSTEAVRLIRDASKWYGTQGRAIQVAAEILFRFPDTHLRYPGALDRPADSAMTYRLDPRTISIVEHLAHTRYKTRGRVLAACSVLLAQTPETPRV